MESAIYTALPSNLTHLENKSSYIMMLFVDLSSTFNTEHTLGLSSTLCNWILDSLISWPRRIRIGSHIFSALALNTGTAQGCVFSLLLFTLHTHDCTPKTSSERYSEVCATITTIIGCIINNDENSYQEDIGSPAEWCTDNNHLFLGTTITDNLFGMVHLGPGQEGSK